MRQKSVLFCIAFTLFTSLQMIAQAPTVQDCLGAIPICQPVYSEDQVLPGDGNYNNEVNSLISCVDGEDYSIWYTFTVHESGDFGFVLTPNNSLDDYDWALFNITDADCSDIYNDASLLVSCNAAGGTGLDPNACSGPTGATGASSYDIQGAGCYAAFPDYSDGNSPFNNLIPVTAGNTYVLMVSNWSASNYGYTINFGISDVGIFDFEAPELQDLNLPENCNDNTIAITFNENVDCNTISEANFTLTGPAGESYTLGLSSSICDAGGEYHDAFSLSVSPALIDSGTYTLEIISEMPDPITDLCGNPLASSSHSFLLDSPGLPVVELGESQGICDGQSVVLDAGNPQATYLWQDGAATPTYTVNNSGTYAVTVTNACGQASDAVNISLLSGAPSVELGADTILCTGEQILLNAASEEATYLWQDGSTGPTYVAASAGSYAVTATNACGEDTDEISISYHPDLSVDLNQEYSACEGDVIELDVFNPSATYLWQDGSAQSSYLVTESGAYAVTISNDCQVLEAGTVVEFISAPAIELGNDTVLCEGEQLLLQVDVPGAVYQWQDGSTSASMAVTNSGIYGVTAINECGQGEDAIQVSYIPGMESVDLGESRYLCDGVVVFDLTAYDFASYHWQDGNNLPYYEASRPGLYSVEVSTACETVVDTVTLFECEYCNVYIPNAFSPNDDGRNDLFRPQSPCELKDYEFLVFDRWGNQLFSTANPDEGWDGRNKGRPMTVGVYAWALSYTVEANGQVEQRSTKGDIMLMR
ncbi:MAG: gliding motility-associated C-terminal domain-containing protein [Phaeodactylibacter sp.]|nr:gliding motility-associated C-terminal domain-containing protein [Phaeodactylibacter sp.]MCB9289723.1 gliding motility-associated C-terminal domain-containing protein [Lewinellaceae bacterium]